LRRFFFRADATRSSISFRSSAPFFSFRRVSLSLYFAHFIVDAPVSVVFLRSRSAFRSFLLTSADASEKSSVFRAAFVFGS